MAVATVAVEHNSAGREWTRSLVERGLVAGRSFWFYLHTLAWPRALAFIYPRWTIDPQVWWQYLFPAAAVVGACRPLSRPAADRPRPVGGRAVLRRRAGTGLRVLQSLLHALRVRGGSFRLSAERVRDCL